MLNCSPSWGRWRPGCIRRGRRCSGVPVAPCPPRSAVRLFFAMVDVRFRGVRYRPAGAIFIIVCTGLITAPPAWRTVSRSAAHPALTPSTPPPSSETASSGRLLRPSATPATHLRNTAAERSNKRGHMEQLPATNAGLPACPAVKSANPVPSRSGNSLYDVVDDPDADQILTIEELRALRDQTGVPAAAPATAPTAEIRVPNQPAAIPLETRADPWQDLRRRARDQRRWLRWARPLAAAGCLALAGGGVAVLVITNHSRSDPLSPVKASVPAAPAPSVSDLGSRERYLGTRALDRPPDAYRH